LGAGAAFFGTGAAAFGAGGVFFGAGVAVFGAVAPVFGEVAAGATAFGVAVFFVLGGVFFVAILILSIRFTRWLRRRC
jgi:hypothetical protein